jgi:hypothetical protein
MRVEADEIVVSALCDRSKIAPWGLFGGHEGTRTAFLVRRAGESDFRTFGEAFGMPSDTKFSNVRLRRGDEVSLRSPSGGGYGPPHERPPENVARDVREGYVSPDSARSAYGVAVREDGTVDEAETGRLRAGPKPAPEPELVTDCHEVRGYVGLAQAPEPLGRWVERREPWHRTDVDYCEVTGKLLPRRYWSFEHDGREVRAADPRAERLFHEYVLPRRHGG